MLAAMKHEQNLRMRTELAVGMQMLTQILQRSQAGSMKSFCMKFAVLAFLFRIGNHFRRYVRSEYQNAVAMGGMKWRNITLQR